MTIRDTRSAIQLQLILLVMFFSLTGLLWAAGIAAENDIPPRSPALGLLLSGSAQAVLAVCLLSVSAALTWTSKLLIDAYRDRIAALERAIGREADMTSASVNLAGALRELKEHCRDARNGRPSQN